MPNTEISKLQNDLKLCSAALQSREGDISNLENEIAMLRNKNANSDAQLSKANDEIAILRRERLQEVEKSKRLEDELNKLSATTQKDRSALESHIKLIEEKLVRAEADLVGEQAKSKTLAVTITKLESDQANYEDESNRRNEAFEKLETEITERDAKIGQLVKTTDELTKDRDHYKNESDYFKSQEDKAIVLEDKLLVERKAHEEQVARLKKEIEEVMAQKVTEAVSSDEDDDSSEKDTKRERAGPMVFSMPLPSIEEQFEACAKQRPDLLKALALAHFPDFFRSADHKDTKDSGDEQDVKGVKKRESKQADADGKDVKYPSVNSGLSGFDSEDERERKRFGHTRAPTNPFNSPSVATNTDLKATDIEKLELKATEANKLKEEVAEMSKLKQTMIDVGEDGRNASKLDELKQKMAEMEKLKQKMAEMEKLKQTMAEMEKLKQTVPDMDGLVHIKSTSVARFMNLKYLTETSPLTQLAFWAVMALLTLSCLAAWLCGADYYHLTQARQMLNYANALTYEYTQEVLENPTLQYPLDFGKVIYDWFAWWPYNHSGFILRYVDLDFTTVG
jgi:chromosome segregation ATPase